MNILQQLHKAKAKVKIIEVEFGCEREQSDYVRATNANSNRKRAKTYEGKTTAEWALVYNCPAQTIQARIKRTGNPHPVAKSTPLLYKGRSIADWAKHYGMTGPGIRYQLKKYGNLDHLD